MGDDWPGSVVADRSLRILDQGRILIGGSPLTLLRFSTPIDPTGTLPPQTRALLIDRGLIHPQPTSSSYSAADVTVVIPVFDAPDALAKTLRALQVCGDDVRTVIVVDDLSHDPDRVREVIETARSGGELAIDHPGARGATKRIRRTRRKENGGAGAARNTGVGQVSTDLVAFIDAGCEPQPGWLEPLLAHFGDPLVAVAAPRIVAVEQPAESPIHADRASNTPAATQDQKSQSSPTNVLRPSTRPWSAWIRTALSRYETVRSPLDLGDLPARIRSQTRVSYVPSACLVARVEALRSIRGFDESLRVGEDVDLEWRLNADRSHWRLRYEPRSRVAHDHRVDFWSWARRRIDYGTSAAPLAQRHPGALSPVSLSPWSMAAWLFAAAGRPAMGVGVGAVSTGLLARKLRVMPHATQTALRLAGAGNVGAGRLLATALRREWLPVLLVSSVFSRHARRVAAAVLIALPVAEWCIERPRLDPVTWTLLRGADDAAYGVGVWIGCAQKRTIAPLIPTRDKSRRGKWFGSSRPDERVDRTAQVRHDRLQHRASGSR